VNAEQGLLDAVERLNETIERLQGERDRLAEYVIAHALVEAGVVDFNLHAETVERLRRAQEANQDLIAEALVSAGLGVGSTEPGVEPSAGSAPAPVSVIRDALDLAHRGRGLADDETHLDGCRGCDALAALDVLVGRLEQAGKYGKGRTFDELAEIAAARFRYIKELEVALEQKDEALRDLYNFALSIDAFGPEVARAREALGVPPPEGTGS
jgi:hypothetical protein